MKRYRVKLFDEMHFNQMIEHPDGDWVQWEDSLQVGEIYERRIRELKAKIELKGTDSEGGKMKRYRMEPYSDPSHTDVNVQANEDPNGAWVRWEDVKEIEKLGLQSHDGYVRIKGIATDMAASLHQVFDRDAATLRFKIKDCQPIIIDIDMDVFEEFMRTHSMEPEGLKCNCEEMAKGKMAEYPHMLMEAWWICPAHGYKRR